MVTIYDYTVKTPNNKDFPLKSYAGKVLLIVNTATGCGFTPQYSGLEKLYEEYHADGFEILDFPCNQFAHQAPGSDAEIAEFCTLNYHTTFPRFKKLEVIGDKADPLFKHLSNFRKIKWNFTKFLVDRDGAVIKTYGSMTKPEKIEKDLKEILNA